MVYIFKLFLSSSAELHESINCTLEDFCHLDAFQTQNVLQMDEKTGTKHVPDSASVADLTSLQYKKLLYFITPLFTPEVSSNHFVFIWV